MIRNIYILLLLSLSFSIVLGAYNVGDTISLNDQNTIYNICYEVTNDEILGEYPEGQMRLSDFNGALNGGAYSILIITLNRGEMFDYVHDSSWQGYFDDPEIKNITNLYDEDGWCEYYGNSGIAGFPLIFSDNSFIHLFYTQNELNNDCVFPSYIVLDHTMTVMYENCGNVPSWGIISFLQQELEEFLNEIDDSCNALAGDLNEDEILNIQDIIMMVSHIVGNETLEDCALEAADINLDGIVNVQDVILLINTILNP